MESYPESGLSYYDEEQDEYGSSADDQAEIYSTPQEVQRRGRYMSGHY
jgi:hypothetical protein